MKLDQIMPISATMDMTSSMKIKVKDDTIAAEQIMTTDSATQIYLESR